MADAFDPSRAVRFDVPKGVVYSSTEQRLVVLGVEALEAVVRAIEPSACSGFGRTVGDAIGQRVADRLGGPEGVRRCAFDVVVAHLSGELAVAGFGQMSVERWGRAMVISLERPAFSHDAFTAAILAGALEASTGRAVACEPLARDRTALRVLVAREATARRARAYLEDGVTWGDVLARIQPHGGASA